MGKRPGNKIKNRRKRRERDLYQVAFKRLLFINVIANTSLLSINSVKQSLAQTPGPDLAWQDAVMQSEAFIISENSCIPTSRRASRSRLGLGTGRAG